MVGHRRQTSVRRFETWDLEQRRLTLKGLKLWIATEAMERDGEAFEAAVVRRCH